MTENKNKINRAKVQTHNTAFPLPHFLSSRGRTLTYFPYPSCLQLPTPTNEPKTVPSAVGDKHSPTLSTLCKSENHVSQREELTEGKTLPSQERKYIEYQGRKPQEPRVQMEISQLEGQFSHGIFLGVLRRFKGKLQSLTKIMLTSFYYFSFILTLITCCST